VQLGVGSGVEGDLKVEGTDLIAVCCFFAIGAIVVVLEVLCDANYVKDMPAVETTNPLYRVLQTNGTVRYLIEVLIENWLFVWFRHSRPT
jgi:hypothetical protein